MPMNGTKEEAMEYARNLEVKEFHAFMAGELWEGRQRFDFFDERFKSVYLKMEALPCKDWHESLLRWLTALVLLVGGSAICLIVGLIVKHVIS